MCQDVKSSALYEFEHLKKYCDVYLKKLFIFSVQYEMINIYYRIKVYKAKYLLLLRYKFCENVFIYRIIIIFFS